MSELTDVIDNLTAELERFREMHAETLIAHSTICSRFAERIRVLESALNSLLPGLVLDRRYADADDDIGAMNSRIETVQEALYPPQSAKASDV